MSRGVEAPLALTAIAVAVGNGWIESMWNWVYTTTHTGGSTNPFSTSSNPFNPVTVGKGGDLATGGLAGFPQVSVTGTINNGTMTPNDSSIPPFKVGPSSNQIPSGTLSLLYRLFGTKPSSGGAQGVTVW
jgi:hypothetical protein